MPKDIAVGARRKSIDHLVHIANQVERGEKNGAGQDLLVWRKTSTSKITLAVSLLLNLVVERVAQIGIGNMMKKRARKRKIVTRIVITIGKSTVRKIVMIVKNPEEIVRYQRTAKTSIDPRNT